MARRPSFSLCGNPWCGACTLRAVGRCPDCGESMVAVMVPEGIARVGTTALSAAERLAAYALGWWRRLGDASCTAVVMGPTGAGKSALIDLAIGWPALWRRGGAHTTRCPAVIRPSPDGTRALAAVGSEGTLFEETMGPLESYPAWTASRVTCRLWSDPDDAQLALRRRLRDDFWLPLEKRFSGWREDGLPPGARVEVCTTLDRWPEDAVLLDVPGFDGRGDSGGDLERELAATTRFWCEFADIVLFVFDETGLNRHGEAEMLRHRLAVCPHGDTAVFINKLDRVDPADLGVNTLDNDVLRKAGRRFRTEKHAKLAAEGVVDIPLFLGFADFDRRGKPPPDDVLRRRWRRGAGKALAWMVGRVGKYRRHRRQPPSIFIDHALRNASGDADALGERLEQEAAGLARRFPDLADSWATEDETPSVRRKRLAAALRETVTTELRRTRTASARVTREANGFPDALTQTVLNSYAFHPRWKSDFRAADSSQSEHPEYAKMLGVIDAGRRAKGVRLKDDEGFFNALADWFRAGPAKGDALQKALSTCVDDLNATFLVEGAQALAEPLSPAHGNAPAWIVSASLTPSELARLFDEAKPTDTLAGLWARVRVLFEERVEHRLRGYAFAATERKRLTKRIADLREAEERIRELDQHVKCLRKERIARIFELFRCL